MGRTGAIFFANKAASGVHLPIFMPLAKSGFGRWFPDREGVFLASGGRPLRMKPAPRLRPGAKTLGSRAANAVLVFEMLQTRLLRSMCRGKMCCCLNRQGKKLARGWSIATGRARGKFRGEGLSGRRPQAVVPSAWDLAPLWPRAEKLLHGRAQAKQQWWLPVRRLDRQAESEIAAACSASKAAPAVALAGGQS